MTPLERLTEADNYLRELVGLQKEGLKSLVGDDLAKVYWKLEVLALNAKLVQDMLDYERGETTVVSRVEFTSVTIEPSETEE